MTEIDFMHPSRYLRIDRPQGRAPIPLHIRYGVFLRDDHRCIMCGHYGPPSTLHLDHILPWSYGGSDASANLRTLCAGCNLKRSNWRIPEDARKVLPIASGCIDCQPSDQYDGLHEWGALAFCVPCGFASYSQLIDSCWMPEQCCGYSL